MKETCWKERYQFLVLVRLPLNDFRIRIGVSRSQFLLYRCDACGSEGTFYYMRRPLNQVPRLTDSTEADHLVPSLGPKSIAK
jgi:hypothetical protein